VVRLMSEAKAEVEAEKVIGVVVEDVRLVVCESLVLNTDKRSWHQKAKE